QWGRASRSYVGPHAGSSLVEPVDNPLEPLKPPRAPQLASRQSSPQGQVFQGDSSSNNPHNPHNPQQPPSHPSIPAISQGGARGRSLATQPVSSQSAVAGGDYQAHKMAWNGGLVEHWGRYSFLCHLGPLFAR